MFSHWHFGPLHILDTDKRILVMWMVPAINDIAHGWEAEAAVAMEELANFAQELTTAIPLSN